MGSKQQKNPTPDTQEPPQGTHVEEKSHLEAHMPGSSKASACASNYGAKIKLPKKKIFT